MGVLGSAGDLAEDLTLTVVPIAQLSESAYQEIAVLAWKTYRFVQCSIVLSRHVRTAFVVHRRLDNVAKSNRSLEIVTEERRDLTTLSNRTNDETDDRTDSAALILSVVENATDASIAEDRTLDGVA